MVNSYKLMSRIGIISDTHSLLRPEARNFLVGCDQIVHAGDICGPEIIEALARIAPVTAARGNDDRGEWARGLAETVMLKVGEVWLYVIHDLAQLDIEPRAAKVRVVISGHSHKPRIEQREEVLYLNPGSAGPRRFALPISIGELIVQGSVVNARLVEL